MAHSNSSSISSSYVSSAFPTDGSDILWNRVESISIDGVQNSRNLRWCQFQPQNIEPHNRSGNVNEQFASSSSRPIPWCCCEHISPMPNNYIPGNIMTGTNNPMVTETFVNTAAVNGAHPIFPPKLHYLSTHNELLHHQPFETSPASVAPGVVQKRKRTRITFTTEQIEAMEQVFKITPYIDRTRRIELANALGISERSVKIWFQNRRMKEKKFGNKNPQEHFSCTDYHSELTDISEPDSLENSHSCNPGEFSVDIDIEILSESSECQAPMSTSASSDNIKEIPQSWLDEL